MGIKVPIKRQTILFVVLMVTFTFYIQFAQNMYKSLPDHMSRMFETKESRPVDDISEIDVNALLDEIFSVFVIKSTKKTADNNIVVYNIIPKAKVSLKVCTRLFPNFS